MNLSYQIREILGPIATHGQTRTLQQLLFTSKLAMSSPPPKSAKRKWDQPAGDDSGSSKVAKTDESKTASEAAAAAAAIAAKIAAQFASGALGDGEEFTQDIDINDVRNRYLLTKGSTQEQVRI